MSRYSLKEELRNSEERTTMLETIFGGKKLFRVYITFFDGHLDKEITSDSTKWYRNLECVLQDHSLWANVEKVVLLEETPTFNSKTGRITRNPVKEKIVYERKT